MNHNQIDTVYAYDGTLATGYVNNVFTFYTIYEEEIDRKGLLKVIDSVNFDDVYLTDVHNAPGQLGFLDFFFHMFNHYTYDPIEEFVLR